MLYYSRWKIALIFIITLLGVYFSAPNLFSKETVDGMPKWIPFRQMALGLDLRGGSHVLLQMEVDDLKKKWLDTIRDDVRETLRKEHVGYANLTVNKELVRVSIRNPEQIDAAYTKLRAMARPVGGSMFSGSGAFDLDVTKESEGVITLKPSDAAMRERVSAAMDSSVETIRRRIDSLGTTEPLIQRQGQDRIVVQVPGLDDPKKLKHLIGETAQLSFQLVDMSMTPEEAKATQVPPGSALYPDAKKEGVQHLLKTKVIVSGEDLVSAQSGFDSQNSEPVVNFRFNTSGAKRFGDVTRENVNKPFAIVLDGKVLSDPVIRTPILDGSGQISGHFTVEETNEFSILLRSGSLPAKLTIVEERSVGPSLGKDSIEAGKKASIIGLIGVAAFMVAAYGLFGLFANFALLVNMVLVIGLLSVLQSTLTLPGIAGIVLTMGMAVDANVLIYERIRDELRSGKTPLAAIDTGFSRAYATIIDANITHLIVGLIMFFLGAGPIRGFAVTLIIGIGTSLFTAITVTRYMIIAWLHYTKPRTVPI
jgi:preprotein translocase subunit SecD